MTSAELIELLKEVGYEPRRYSGRNMYGKHCVSLVTDGSIPYTLANLVECCDNTEQAADLIRRHRTDNMGLDTVIYWPNYEWNDE